MFGLLPINGHSTSNRSEINFNLAESKKKKKKRFVKCVAVKIVPFKVGTWFACAVCSQQLGISYSIFVFRLAN
jgi:hypothetical protein